MNTLNLYDYDTFSISEEKPELWTIETGRRPHTFRIRCRSTKNNVIEHLLGQMPKNDTFPCKYQNSIRIISRHVFVTIPIHSVLFSLLIERRNLQGDHPVGNLVRTERVISLFVSEVEKNSTTEHKGTKYK